MKLNDKMRFPHPVLSEHSTDYVATEFLAEFSYRITNDNKLEITSTLSLDDKELNALIKKQRADVGYFVVCRPTFYNNLQRAALGISQKYFDLSVLNSEVTVRPVIWALNEITNFQSHSIDKEFGEDVDYPKGAIIAIGPEFRFSIDPKKFKPFESIFKLAINDNIEQGLIEIDADQTKIAILAETETHKKIATMRNTPEGRSIMLSAVYMPAIAEIVARRQSGDIALENNSWYKVFAAKCADLGIQPEAKSQTPLNIAQLLLRAPLEQTFKALSVKL